MQYATANYQVRGVALVWPRGKEATVENSEH